VPRDYSAAHGWYLAAARQGHARSQFNLGLMYLSGQGVPADALAATLWLQRAAHAGAPDAERFASQASARMNDFQRARYQRELQQHPQQNSQQPPSAPPAPTRA
jgi:hypothetical protein